MKGLIRNQNMYVEVWPTSRSDEAVDALVDSFYSYPVMRYVIGDAGEDYDRRIRLLIGLFVAGRVMRDHPILAVAEGGRAVAVATITPPGGLTPLPQFQALRDALWTDLGEGSKARYEGLVQVWERLEVPGPQYHLNMLGVRSSHAGRGLGRLLLDAVHERSKNDSASAGVSLSTEDPKNVLLYEHCGYEVRNHERVSPELETWILFRRDDG